MESSQLNWIGASCDELRGGMDASQYKDYVLFMLFIKYVSDKYGNSSDRINTQVIQPLIDANARLARSDFPDFNDPNKLGDAYEYLMRHFATESGKSKGQFYTPSEVSRVIAQQIAKRQAVMHE